MLEQFLEDIGLSEKEAKIYLALLPVEHATISKLAEKSTINRTTIYPVLESLQRKGLVSEVREAKKISYATTPSQQLEKYVERQRLFFEEKSRRLKEIIPQIQNLKRAGENHQEKIVAESPDLYSPPNTPASEQVNMVTVGTKSLDEIAALMIEIEELHKKLAASEATINELMRAERPTFDADAALALAIKRARGLAA